MGHAVRSMLAPQAAVDAMFRQAGVIQVDTLDEMFDVAQLVAHQPLPRGSRVAVVGNSDALGLLAADAAVTVGLQVTQLVALGADATAEDFEEALDAAIDDDEVDSVVAVFIPPLNTTGEEVADVLAAVGEQSDKPLVSTFLAAEGIPELLRVPDVAGSTAGRGSVPSYPAARPPSARWPGWWSTPPGWPSRSASWSPPTASTRWPRAPWCRRSSSADDRGRDLTFDELHTLLAAYGIDLWDRVEVATVDEAVAAAERLGYDVVLKATAEHLRQRPDLAHVWRNIDTEDEMRDAWQTMQDARGQPGRGGVHRPAERGARGAGVARRHGGPAVRTGGVLRRLRAGDRAARGPVLPDPADAQRRRQRHGPRDPGGARCCSATGAASRSTSTRSSTCCCASPS